MRELREEDHGTIVSVVDRWWGGRSVAGKLPRLFFGYFQDTSFVVEEGEEIVAFLIGLVGASTKEAYIHFVGVHPEHRRKGIGERLYGLFFDEVRRLGCKKGPLYHLSRQQGFYRLSRPDGLRDRGGRRRGRWDKRTHQLRWRRKRQGRLRKAAHLRGWLS